MGWLHSALDLFLHLDKHLNDFAGAHQTGVYVLLVAIVFCETGLVVTPFLPGDSLLFAVGALAATTDSPINLPLVVVLLCLAANCGDLLNYFVGRRVGPAVFRKQLEGSEIAAAERSTPSTFSRVVNNLLNRKHLEEAQAFYDHHGRKTIILARFVPIVRTFAPFVAGIGRMQFSRFVGFSVGGGMLWVVLLTQAGYRFGKFDAVKKHFELVVLAIVAISLLPMVLHYFQAKGKTKVAAVGVSESV